jgi:catechol 2,3-dioxygenase-like lactoylglutathione lyase family enzyme
MPSIRAKSLDHVALWVDDREPLAAFLCENLGMHLIEGGDDFSLLGAHAREGKLTLFSAEGPRERGALERIFLRVADLEAAVASLPDDLELARSNGAVEFDAPQDVALGLVRGAGLEYDLDHVRLRVPDPAATAGALAELGFERRGETLAVADRYVELSDGDQGDSGRPLLNHLALLVDSAEDLRLEAERRGLEIEKVVDAENTLAVFVRGPAGIVVEYVEHKPTFSLV